MCVCVCVCGVGVGVGGGVIKWDRDYQAIGRWGLSQTNRKIVGPDTKPYWSWCKKIAKTEIVI